MIVFGSMAGDLFFNIFEKCSNQTRTRNNLLFVDILCKCYMYICTLLGVYRYIIKYIITCNNLNNN